MDINEDRIRRDYASANDVYGGIKIENYRYMDQLSKKVRSLQRSRIIGLVVRFWVVTWVVVIVFKVFGWHVALFCIGTPYLVHWVADKMVLEEKASDD